MVLITTDVMVKWFMFLVNWYIIIDDDIDDVDRLGQASNRAVFIAESAATATERKKCTPFLLSFRLRYLFGFYMFVVLRFLLIYCYCLFDLGFLLLSVMSLLLLSHCYVGHCHRFWFVISFLICCCCYCFPHHCGLF